MMRWLRVLWYVLSLRCDEADRVRCVPDPDELPTHQRLGERAHRMLCGSCRAAKRRLDELTRSLEDQELETEDVAGTCPTPTAALDNAARERILKAMRDEL